MRSDPAEDAPLADPTARDTVVDVVRTDVDRDERDIVRLQECDGSVELVGERGVGAVAGAFGPHRRRRLTRTAELGELQPANLETFE
jgi:hypothetical protein